MVHYLAFELLHGYPPAQRIVTGFPTSATVTTQTRPVFPKWFGACSVPFVTLHRASCVIDCLLLTHVAAWSSFAHARLVALHPSSTSPTPTQALLTAPMLSIADLIMDRQVCISSYFVSMWRICQQWLTFYFAVLSLHPPLVDGFR